MPNPTLSAEEIAVKLLLIGEAGSGKTGSLFSLVKAGYRLIVLDCDGKFNTSWLINKIRREPDAKELLSHIHYASPEDDYTTLPNGDIVVQGVPKAWPLCSKLLTHWKIGSEDLGKSDTWGPDTVVVVDSFSFMCRAAFRWAESTSGNPDPRSHYGLAQRKAESALNILCSTKMKSHVILTAHWTLIDMIDGLSKAFPATIGKAISPDIPKYFNSMLEVKSKIAGTSVRRIIRTVPDGIFEMKHPVPEGVPNELPIETGLADFFRAVTGVNKAPARDKSAA